MALGFHFLFRSFGIFFARRFLLQLCPNLFEFRFNHRRWHVEVMTGGKLIQQLALHISARQAVMLLLNLNLHQFAQFVYAVQAEHLGKIVIRLSFNGLAHFVDDDVKSCRLTLQVFSIIIVWEGYIQNLFVIGFHANQLVFETGDQLTRAKLNGHAFALTAFERHAIDFAFKIDDDAVAHFGSIFLVGCFKALLAFGKPQNRFIDLRVAHFHSQAVKRNAVNRWRGNCR